MSKEMSFAVFCLENYRTYRKLTGKEVMHLFQTYDVLSYLVDYYDTLHTVGYQYLMEDIDEYLLSRGFAL